MYPFYFFASVYARYVCNFNVMIRCWLAFNDDNKFWLQIIKAINHEDIFPYLLILTSLLYYWLGTDLI